MRQTRTDMLIRVLREAKGLTQAELGEGICAKDTLSRIETGKRTPSKYVFECLKIRNKKRTNSV